jgi:hypothetical protein
VELAEAVATAKRLKYERGKNEIEARRREEFRREVERPWTAQELYGFVLDYRAAKIGFSANEGADGKKVFVVDDMNRDFLKAMCYYFTSDPKFEKLCSPDGDGGMVHHNWRLNKGIMVVGDVGTGKTALMKLFARNKRQCFDVMNCIDISFEFARKGDEAIQALGHVHRYQPRDPYYFYHTELGICFDDLGTEEEKQHFGNRSNVMAEVILKRYAAGLDFDMTHITTNLTADALKEMYGPRVWSRMMEMFNIVELRGTDRRVG